MDKIKVSLKDAWLTLHVEGDIKISYPLFGDEQSRNRFINNFASDLKRVLNGESLSSLR